MPSFSCDSFIKVYSVHRAAPDSHGQKGYNIYHTQLRLGNNSVVPITTAHQTSEPPLWCGTRGRTTASVAVRDRSLLFTANDVAMVGFNPIAEATDKPTDYIDLPRFMLDGYVVNPRFVDPKIPDAFAFDVRIERPDLAPYHSTDVRCWVNRGKQRFVEANINGLVENALVAVSGRFCGWDHKDNIVMLDVHDMGFTHEGAVPVNTLGILQRIWERATWVDGYGTFYSSRVPVTLNSGYTISVLAMPSQRAPDAQPLDMPIPMGWVGEYRGPTQHPAALRAAVASSTRDPRVPRPDGPPRASPSGHSTNRSSSEEDARAALAVPRPRAPTPRHALEVASAADVAPGRFFITIPSILSRRAAIADMYREKARAAASASRGAGADLPTVQELLDKDRATLSPSPPSSVVAAPPTPTHANGTDDVHDDVRMSDDDDSTVAPSVPREDVAMDAAPDSTPTTTGKRKRSTRSNA